MAKKKENKNDAEKPFSGKVGRTGRLNRQKKIKKESTNDGTGSGSTTEDTGNSE